MARIGRSTQLKTNRTPLNASLLEMLEEKTEGGAILLQGDSTANGTNEWFYIALQRLAARYPSTSFRHRLWADTTQSYSPYTTIQEGSSGDAFLILDANTKYLTTPHKTAYNVTDLDIRAKISQVDWSSTGPKSIIDKLGGAGTRAWQLYTHLGKLILYISIDGTNLVQIQSTTTVSFAANVAQWVRVTRVASTGVTTFYTSSDGITWTQLGNTVTAATGNMATNTQMISIGTRGGTESINGNIYYAEMRDSINGKTLFSPDLDSYPVSTTFVDGESNTWTINGTPSLGGSPGVIVYNSSHPGAGIAYSTDATRFGLQTPVEPLMSLISYSHNEGATVAYAATYKGLIDQIRAKYAHVPIVCVTQNPKASPSTAINIRAHASRNRQIKQVAAAFGHGLIDGYRSISSKDSLSTYVDADGIHPSADGTELWAKEAEKILI